MGWSGLGDPEQNSVPGFDPIKEQYVRLDLNRWLKKHNVRKRAETLGAVDQPPSDSTVLDGQEAQMIAWINHRGRKCREDVARRLSDFERELVKVENDQELSALEQEIAQIETEAEIELESKLNSTKNRISRLQRHVVDTRRDLEHFKTQSRLTRPADYSHRSSAIKYILACGAGEAFLNASFLMDVSPQGWIGAALLMLVISGVNVLALGGIVGELLRQAHDRRILITLAASLGIIGTSIVAFLFNLGVGHYRDSVQSITRDRNADIFQIGEDALQRYSEHMFELESIESTFLLCLGMICFGFASWKWLQRDDRYPGYGPRSRALDEAHSTYMEMYDEYQKNVTGVYKKFSNKLKDRRHSLQAKQSKWRELCRRGQRLVDEYPVNLRQYQHDLDFLLEAYRTANRAVRLTPTPAHFGNRETVDPDILQAPSFRPPSESDIKDAMNRAHETIRNLQRKYQDIQSEVSTLDEL